MAKLLGVVKRFSQDGIYLCPSATNPMQLDDPNRIPMPNLINCTHLIQKLFRLKGNSIEYLLPFAQRPGMNFSTLVPAKNYGLCMSGPYLPIVQNTPPGAHYCQHFSVYRPFFSFPSDETPFPTGMAKPFRHPEPYLFFPSVKCILHPMNAPPFRVSVHLI